MASQTKSPTTNSGAAWANRNNGHAANTSFATDSGTGNSNSGIITYTGFGFDAMDDDSTIDGIIMNVKAKFSDNGVGGCDFLDIFTLKAGVKEGTDHVSENTLTTSNVVHVFGSSSDDWGGTWTGSDIKGTTFGAHLQFVFAGMGGVNWTVSIDHVELVVHYTDPVGGGAKMSLSTGLLL